jgi:hypothetical protein
LVQHVLNKNVSNYLYVCCLLQDYATLEYSADEKHRIVIQTNTLLSLLQLLLSIVTIACLVLVEPRNTEPMRQTIARVVFHRYIVARSYNPTVTIVNNRPRQRPVPPRFFVRPTVNPVAAPPAAAVPVAPAPAVPAVAG